ncbi:DMT family transporter [Burkholderia cepacia]|uniref:DMT family transporter n=1 Tax=Burkholderia cepacia TaxID=292 RepID=UPI0009BC729D|nr:DMT family transporter [Burkholderia cepacia]
MSGTVTKSSERFWALSLVGITALWGWSFVAIHDALSTLSASAFNSYRFLVASFVLVVIVIPVLGKFTKQEFFGGLYAGLALFCAFAFQTAGLKYTTASNAAFITGLAVVFTPLFSFLILRLNPTRQQLIGAVIATIGLGLLTIKGLSVHFGDILVLGCAASFALHIVILSRASKSAHSGRITLVQILVVGLASLAWSVMFGEFSLPKTGSSIWAIVIIGVLGTTLGFFVQTKAQISSPPSRIALIIVLEPVFGGLFGYFLAGDRLSGLNLIGAMLIILGMVVTEYRFSRATARPEIAN